MPNSEPCLRAFAGREEMVTRLADRIAGIVAQAVAARGRALLVLSGGTTPATLYEKLSGIDLPWDRVELTLSDERWVEPSDPASNEGMVGRTLLKGRAAGARLVGLKSAGATPDEGLAATGARLAGLHWPADLVLLGMGEDAHTASLFPGGEGLAQALSPAEGVRVAGIVPAAGGPARISLTRPALLEAREIALLITGDGKRRVYERALEPGPVETMPVRAVLHQIRVPVSVWWAP